MPKSTSTAKADADATLRAEDKKNADTNVADLTKQLSAVNAELKAAQAEQTKADAALAKAEAKASANPDDGVAANEAFAAYNAAVDAAGAVGKATVKVVEVETALAEAKAAAEALKPIGKDAQWYYCLESSHAKEVIDDERFFQSDSERCPTCPVCRREVSAVLASGYGIYPSGILSVAARLS